MLVKGLIVRLSIAALLLQTLLAPLQCLAYGAMRDIRMVVQTEDGARILIVQHGDDSNPASDPAQRFSPACCATGTALPPAMPTIVPVIWAATPMDWQAPSGPSIGLGARAPPFDATGPPA